MTETKPVLDKSVAAIAALLAVAAVLFGVPQLALDAQTIGALAALAVSAAAGFRAVKESKTAKERAALVAELAAELAALKGQAPKAE